MLFLIAGSEDPLYEISLGATPSDHLSQFIVHAALDRVEGVSKTSPLRYHRNIDSFNDQVVSAYVTAGGIKFLLLHTGADEACIREFLSTVHEQYVKLCLNPFYKRDSEITSEKFDRAVRAAAARLLVPQ